MKRLFSFGAVAAVLILAGCRGTESDSPPIHPNLNMDFQERFDPQEPSAFFADGRAMRPKVPGTVARGFLREDRVFYEGRNAGGGLVQQSPLPITRALLERGQERYNIYCTPCHGEAGDGRGLVTTGGYGYTPAPTFHSAQMRAQPDGHFFDVITNGIRTMPPYRSQVPVADRWAIVSYIRALQRSQSAPLADVPPSRRGELQQQSGTADAVVDTVAAATQDTSSAPDQGVQE